MENNTLELVKYIVGNFAEKAVEMEYTVVD